MENERSGRRIASWWLRFEDLNWPNADTLDRIKRRAEGMARADVTAAMIFGAHFRWDFMPFFPILRDYIATVAEELHKYDIKLFDHHSVNLVLSTGSSSDIKSASSYSNLIGFRSTRRSFSNRMLSS